jgi:hypothetical protein
MMEKIHEGEELVYKAWLADAIASSGCVWTTTKPEYVTRLARDFQRLRNERVKVIDVWLNSHPDWDEAIVTFYEKGIKQTFQTIYHRELPKTIEQEIIDKVIPLEDDSRLMTSSSARHKCAKAIAEYKDRTK